jgi:hypothetical protein
VCDRAAESLSFGVFKAVLVNIAQLHAKRKGARPHEFSWCSKYDDWWLRESNDKGREMLVPDQKSQRIRLLI